MALADMPHGPMQAAEMQHGHRSSQCRLTWPYRIPKENSKAWAVVAANGPTGQSSPVQLVADVDRADLHEHRDQCVEQRRRRLLEARTQVWKLEIAIGGDDRGLVHLRHSVTALTVPVLPRQKTSRRHNAVRRVRCIGARQRHCEKSVAQIFVAVATCNNGGIGQSLVRWDHDT